MTNADNAAEIERGRALLSTMQFHPPLITGLPGHTSMPQEALIPNNEPSGAPYAAIAAFLSSRGFECGRDYQGASAQNFDYITRVGLSQSVYEQLPEMLGQAAPMSRKQ